MVPRSTSFFTYIAVAALAFVFLSSADVLASIGGTPQPRPGVASKSPAQKKAAAPAAPLAEMPTWLNDYADALEKAKAGQKMLLVHFCQPNNTNCAAIERSLTNSRVRHRVQNYVLARVGTDATISQEGRNIRLLEHSSFSELHGGPGLAVIDLAHKKQPYYGRVVSALPVSSVGMYQFHPEHVPTLLDLPAGTITQRTMIFAVRTHPERPASTHGEADPVLIDEAASHSMHQARIRNQGHHQWGSRFSRIIGRRSGFGAPVEIVAESWPGQGLTDACIDCIQSWRQSSGHWRNVRTRHASYGYDIRKGSNGIWYATGIFAN